MIAGSVRDWIQTAATVLAALAAACAVVLALWLQVWVAKRRRAKLTMSFSPVVGEGYSPTLGKEHRTLWVRFLITNVGRGDTAEDVEVLVAGVRSADGRQTQHVVPARNLAWSDISTGKVNLPSGVARYVDVVAIEVPTEVRREPQMELVMFPWASKDPRDESDEWKARHVLSKGDYLLDFFLSARSVGARRYRAKLSFSGQPVENPADYTAQIQLELQEVLAIS